MRLRESWSSTAFSSEIRRTMLDTPEQPVVPGGRRVHLYENVLSGKGNLMLASRYDTVSGRLTALWSEASTFGFGWIPVKGASRAYEKAICAWWNSTPARLLLLNRRTNKLTYPKWSVAHLVSMPCPGPRSHGCAELAKAWERTCREPLLPLRDAEHCAVRQAIDEGAAAALGIHPGVVVEWRRRLAAEPTIRNKPAVDQGC